MKINTSELTGAALDWAVAKCEGHTDGKDFAWYYDRRNTFNFSTVWAQGGPIIGREKIDLTAHLDYWEAKLWANREVLNGMPLAIATATLRSRKVSNSIRMHDPMPLVAAMRCYVAAKLGDEVDLPEELTT